MEAAEKADSVRTCWCYGLITGIEMFVVTDRVPFKGPKWNPNFPSSPVTAHKCLK